MQTNLYGRLRNTSLPFNHGLLPLFEAVINSIHSIEEILATMDGGSITIEIIRTSQQEFEIERDDKKRGPDPARIITGFKISDNGIGFNESNMDSFLTLDSEYKSDKGGRGVGRLLWLKAFKKASISSIFTDKAGITKSRVFSFIPDSGVPQNSISDVSEDTPRITSVYLEGFKEKFREQSCKTARTIANGIFEHCLWYFVRAGGAPNIVVIDGDERIALDDVYREHMVSSAETEKMTIKDRDFYLLHIKLRSNSSNSHVISYCAANRLVKEENITGKIPGLYGKLHDDSGEFIYGCYVMSAYLDQTVRSERTDFDILENPVGLFADSEISLSEIREGVLSRASSRLSNYLEVNKKKAKERVEEFVSQRAPRYRPILSRIPDNQLLIDPSISDKDLDLVLHKHLTEIEEQLLITGHDVMKPKDTEDINDYTVRLNEYLRTAEDIKKSDLANYVFHRKVIIDLLEMAIQRTKNGEYNRENIIHNLIVPMGKDSNEIMPDECNLWILDERLAFHNYLASDKPISSMPITDSLDSKEPDICALNVFNNPLLVAEERTPPIAALVVVEIKRPMRKDAGEGEEKDPIEQALGYLKRIRKGDITTSFGRPIPASENIPGFCYVVCDITPRVLQRLEMHDVIRANDGLSYFFYHNQYKSYVEIISFDGLVHSVKRRNRAFFDKLGLPTT